MKIFAELVLRDKSVDSLISKLQGFCKYANGWQTNAKRNADYSTMNGLPCFWIIPPTNLIGVAVAIALAGQTKSRMEMTNIVPQRIGHISMDQYNLVADAFVSKLRMFASEGKVRGMKIGYSTGTIGIDGIVRGPATRRLFEQFLSTEPFNYHPLDVLRLDRFIVALHRWGRNADAYKISRFLQEDKGWSEEVSLWVRERIITGTEILAASGRFRRLLP